MVLAQAVTPLQVGCVRQIFLPLMDILTVPCEPRIQPAAAKLEPDLVVRAKTVIETQIDPTLAALDTLWGCGLGRRGQIRTKTVGE